LEQLNAMCRTEGYSISFLLMCLTALTTLKLTHKKQFTLTSLTHGRRTYVLKRTVGCLMEPLLVFFKLNPKEAWQVFCHRQYEIYIETLEHGRISMLNMLPILFPSAFLNFFNFNYCWCELSTMEFEAEGTGMFSVGSKPIDGLTGSFYLAILPINAGRLKLSLMYQEKKFTRTKIEGIVNTFLALAEKVVHNPNADLASLIQD